MVRIPAIRLVLSCLVLASLAACSGGDSVEADGGPANLDGSSGADAGPGLADASPAPDAQPSGTLCAAKDAPVQLGYTCLLDWSQCSDQRSYGIDCRIENLAGNVFSVCDCKQNGAAGMQFLSTSVCSSMTWEEAEAIVNEECGWDLR